MKELFLQFCYFLLEIVVKASGGITKELAGVNTKHYATQNTKTVTLLPA
jgi:hypothetical protein